MKLKLILFIQFFLYATAMEEECAGGETLLMSGTQLLGKSIAGRMQSWQHQLPDSEGLMPKSAEHDSCLLVDITGPRTIRLTESGQEWELCIPEIVTLEDTEDLMVLSQIESLHRQVRNATSEELEFITRTMLPIENRVKTLMGKLMNTAKKKDTLELAQCFKRNFTSTSIHPKTALKELGITPTNAQDLPLEEIQRLWHLRFDHTKDGSEERFLGRQIWYVIKTQSQLELYRQYLKSDMQSVENDGDLETSISAALKFSYALMDLKHDLQTYTTRRASSSKRKPSLHKR